MLKSKTGPSFLSSAGARETTTFWLRVLGETKPEFLMAAQTRSLDSSTALSGKPTKEKEWSPLVKSTSTSTTSAFNPTTCEENNFTAINLKFDLYAGVLNAFRGGGIGFQPLGFNRVRFAFFTGANAVSSFFDAVQSFAYQNKPFFQGVFNGRAILHLFKSAGHFTCIRCFHVQIFRHGFPITRHFRILSSHAGKLAFQLFFLLFQLLLEVFYFFFGQRHKI